MMRRERETPRDLWEHSRSTHRRPSARQVSGIRVESYRRNRSYSGIVEGMVKRR